MIKHNSFPFVPQCLDLGAGVRCMGPVLLTPLNFSSSHCSYTQIQATLLPLAYSRHLSELTSSGSLSGFLSHCLLQPGLSSVSKDHRTTRIETVSHSCLGLQILAQCRTRGSVQYNVYLNSVPASKPENCCPDIL